MNGEVAPIIAITTGIGRDGFLSCPLSLFSPRIFAGSSLFARSLSARARCGRIDTTNDFAQC